MPLTLRELPCGIDGRIHALSGDPVLCQCLREQGFGEACFVRKMGGTGPILCQLNGTLMAMGPGAAAAILVEPLQPPRRRRVLQ